MISLISFIIGAVAGLICYNVGRRAGVAEGRTLERLRRFEKEQEMSQRIMAAVQKAEWPEELDN